MGHKRKTTLAGMLAVPTPWQEIVVVCAKCSRKLDGGFGPDGEQTLRGALRDTLREQGRRRTVRIVEGGCFGLCPRGAVAVAHGASPGTLLAVPRGESAPAVLEHLGSSAGTVPKIA